MPEESNIGGGKIPGKIQPEQNSSVRIGGKNPAGANADGRTPGNKDSLHPAGSNMSNQQNKDANEKNAITRKDRIAKATADKGLKTLPQNFGDSDGDWSIIDSDDLFETLYLDQQQIALISPEIIKNNFAILDSFWKDKKKLSESGSGQIGDMVKEKYGAQRIANATRKLANAVEQLFTLEKITEYHARLSSQRIRNGALKLEPLLKMMVKDGEADANEIEGIIEEGLLYDLNTEEVAGIIKNIIDTRAFKAHGRPFGTLLSEQLLSVSWMSEEKMKIRQEEDKAKKNAGREIFDNVFAYSVEEIGEIIFNHEKEAKIYMANGLLKNSIDYFSPAKANQFITIIGTQKDEHLRYLQVVYRLKPQLPYRFSSLKTVSSLKDLVNIIFETPENFKAGKEQFKFGYIEIWLQETDKEAYQKFVRIRDTAENVDTAFIEFLYTFHPSLPYRFAGQYTVKTPKELSEAINRNATTWEAAKAELFASLIPVWLATTAHQNIAQEWNKVKGQFNGRQDIGLEYFLHLLNPGLDHSALVVSHSSLSYPKIQSGKVLTTELLFTNTTRGAAEARLGFSKPIPDVALSSETIFINNVSGNNQCKVALSIDSRALLKGVQYETVIQATTFEQQKIDIPLSFQIIFPRNAFVKEVAKYAGIVAACFILLRFVIATAYPMLLNQKYPAFLGWQEATEVKSFIPVFGWAFLLFAAMLYAGIRLLRKKLKQYGKK